MDILSRDTLKILRDPAVRKAIDRMLDDKTGSATEEKVKLTTSASGATSPSESGPEVTLRKIAI